jgi:O-antigen ligase
LELYLNLGLLGLGLLIAFLVASYVTIRRRFKSSQSLGPLSLAMWTVLLIYNVSEAAFRPQFIWISFLMTVLVVPSNVAASRGGGTLRPRFRLTQER